VANKLSLSLSLSLSLLYMGHAIQNGQSGCMFKHCEVLRNEDNEYADEWLNSSKSLVILLDH